MMPDPSVLTVSRLFTSVLLAAGLCAAVPPSVPTTDDLGRVLAARQQIQQFGPQVWPGWSAAPVLLRAGAADTLLGWPGVPPPEFQRVVSLSFDQLPVYRRADHLVPVPAATAWPLGQTWVLALPTLPEFQQAVDAALGRNVVTLDDAAYVRAAVHEGFHAYQFSVLKGHLPAFGAADEAPVLARLGASPLLTGQLTLEAQALRRALGAPTQLEAREAGQMFLRLRAGRRARQPADVPAVERQLEWTEGLARYAEVGVARRASADSWQAFLDDLDQPARIRSGVRDRYALLGAAQGFVLDRLTPGWKAQALPGGAALETLLDRGVHAGQGTARAAGRPAHHPDALRTPAACGGGRHACGLEAGTARGE